MEDIINWLLEDESPAVKYRTLTELLDKPREDTSVKEAYEKLMASPLVIAAIDKFKANKKWEDFNAFSSLAEFGLTKADVPMDDYVERIITGTKFQMMCGRALLLRNLVALGYYDDSRVKEEMAKAFSLIREDGSFRCLSKTKKENDSNLADMGCYRQTATYLLLAAELKKKNIYLPQFEPLAHFFLEHKVAFHPDGEDTFIISEMAGTFYPLDPVKMGLQMILYGLSVLGVADNPACEKAWDLLESKKNENGQYLLEKTFTKPYFTVGKTGKPNKWVSLYGLLAKKNRSHPV